MLQRIQTLFLLVVVVCMTATAVLPVWSYTLQGDTIELVMGELVLKPSVTQEVVQSLNMMYLLGIAVTAAIIALLNIFKFNNRKVQLKIGMVTSLLIIIYMVLTFLFVPKQAIELGGVDISGVHFQFGYYLTVVALLFNILARVFIKKDEDLVRSVDRIR